MNFICCRTAWFTDKREISNNPLPSPFLKKVYKIDLRARPETFTEPRDPQAGKVSREVVEPHTLTTDS